MFLNMNDRCALVTKISCFENFIAHCPTSLGAVVVLGVKPELAQIGHGSPEVSFLNFYMD